MLCDMLSRELRFLCRRVFGCLLHSFSSAMGCFFICLHFRDDDSDRSYRLDKKSDVAVSQNQLSSSLAVEGWYAVGSPIFDEYDAEREDSIADKGNWVSGSPRIGEDIKDEARFLKACGTIPETPVEIRKAGEKLQRSPLSEIHSVTPKFHSWMPNTSPRKLWTDKQPSKLSEGFEIDAESSDHTPISCISDVDNSESTCISSAKVAASGNLISASKVIDDKNISITTPFTPWPAGRNSQGGSKLVHFHHYINICSPDDSLPGNACSGFKVKDSKGKDSAMKIWPPPTPLKLSDEMKTPGTVFPANMENVTKGKAGIRSQYVYSFPNPTTDGSQLKAPNEEISQPNQLSDHQEAKFEATLSNWLKPPIDNRKSFQPTYNKQAQFGRTCGDRPILGLVDTHWNEEEQSQNITPKWWGGNGIPNSTSKYQEDQKVSWHATPFEERLEKALFEESSFGNRSHVRGSPLSLEEDGDDATTQLQSEKTLVPC